MSQISVGAVTPVLLLDASKNSGANFPQSGIIKNPAGSAASLYIDKAASAADALSNLTTSTGFILAAGEAASFDVLNAGMSIYGISATGTITAHVVSRY